MAFNDRWPGTNLIINPRVNGKSVHAVSSQFNTTVFPGPMMPVTWEVSAAARDYIDKLLMEALLGKPQTPQTVDPFTGQIYTQIASQQTIATRQTLTVTHTINVS